MDLLNKIISKIKRFFTLMKGTMIILAQLALCASLSAQPFILQHLSGSTKEQISILNQKEIALKKEFAEKKLTWPAKQIYIRSFKYDSQLEVWVRNEKNGPFQLFKTYKVCTLSGALGPKRIDGDYQVPEGFYYINEFKPQSEFHMALGINYPNASDQLLSDSLRPGNGIFIHGSCVTTGCIPIQNDQIEELYLLAATAHEKGQDFIPVHIFPIRYHKLKSEEYLVKNRKDDFEYLGFSAKLKEVFDFFEQNKKLPLITVNKKGEYVVM